MEILDRIPIELDLNELLRAQRLGKVDQREIVVLIQKSRQLIEPKAVYNFMKVTNVENDVVELENKYSLKSIVLSDKLKKDQTIAIYVVTIGPKLEKYASEISKNTILHSFILEKIADMAVAKAREYVKNLIEERLGGKVSAFGPGTGTGKLFDIKQQEALFKILDPFSNIGVQLTSSFLMLPRKSVSGVLAVIEEEYVACQYCPRTCEGRKRPFIGEYRTIKCEYESH